MRQDGPSPERLLRQIREGEPDGTGKLKIFFGYAAGVGKTYAMLEAAQRIKNSGADVVAGYIEPHARPETMALAAGLEQLPPLEISYKGIKLKEFDLDAALKRKPELILIDELAHTNAEGCRHVKRYQDIEELLRAGINVFTTVNVQHLESLNDIVASITGTIVTERVPDSLFDAAEQVEVIDVEPDELLERMAAGKIYREAQAEQAQAHFFVPKNLAALREIALRRTADRLNRSAIKEGNSNGAGEHILICLSAAPSNAKVIRTAARIAEAFHGTFTALLVESDATRELRGDNQRRLRMNLRLAEQLGAKIATVYGEDTAAQIAEYAKVSGMTKIVVGRTNHRRNRLFPKQNLIDRLTELAPNLDIYVIPDSQPAYRKNRSLRKEPVSFSMIDLGKALLTIATASLVGWLFDLAGFSEANIITIYILGILITAIWTRGWFYSAFSSLLSVVVFNFLFTDPRFTLRAYDTGYPVTFAIMLVAGMITSSLAMRIKTQARQAAGKAYRTEVLLETSQRLQKAENEKEILDFTANQLKKLLGRPVFFYSSAGEDNLSPAPAYPAERNSDLAQYLTAEEQAVAKWVYKNNKHAGATTDTFPGSKCLYLAIRGKSRALAVAGIAVEEYSVPDIFEKNLLVAILDECGMALEKEKLDSEKKKAELAAGQEALRANLLRAISHDLRTPLTSIIGNAGILMENEEVLNEQKRHGLYASIYDDSMWLMNLVENLLSVTRIENGTMHLKMEPELMDEVFHEALGHLDRRSSQYSITTVLEDDLLMAEMDVRLIVQVIINIVNNAVKYTPPGSHIEVSARSAGQKVMVKIADDGPGIPDHEKQHIFDMFYTADNVRGDGRRGLGLGLSLCKSIVHAHGGTISVRDNSPRGSVFCFTLQEVEVNTNE